MMYKVNLDFKQIFVTMREFVNISKCTVYFFIVVEQQQTVDISVECPHINGQLLFCI